jgi:hypothetical protein
VCLQWVKSCKAAAPTPRAPSISDWGFHCDPFMPEAVRYPFHYTRNPEPETRKNRNPKPEARNLKPETRNPRPETRNPKPETVLLSRSSTSTPSCPRRFSPSSLQLLLLRLRRLLFYPPSLVKCVKHKPLNLEPSNLNPKPLTQNQVRSNEIRSTEVCSNLKPETLKPLTLDPKP